MKYQHEDNIASSFLDTATMLDSEEDFISFRQCIENGYGSCTRPLILRALKLGIVASVAIALISVLITTPSPTSAAPLSVGNPCTTKVSGFTGGVNDSKSGVTGAKADIGNDNPAVCEDSTRGSSSAWSMIEDSTGCYYAQTGWAKDYPYSRPQYFYEITTSTCQLSSPVFVGVPAYPSTHNYEVTYDGNNTFHFYVDGTTVGTSQPSVHWVPGGLEYLGEVHDIADQMPGGTSAYVYFQNVLWRQNGSWYGGSLSAKNTFQYGGLWFPGGTNIGIYDTRFSS